MIKIGNLTNKKPGKNNIFSDIHVDFLPKQVSVSKTNNNVSAGNDISADVDEIAIRNSIRNILSQKRYFNPEFGVNLKRYIGGTVSEMTSRAIGSAIERGISLFEPRVRLEKVVVAGNADTFSYNILLLVTLLNFPDSPLMLNAILDDTGNFNYINK